MNYYQIYFTARKIGAIGIAYRMAETVKAANEKRAEAKLYAHFEHIKDLHMQRVPTPVRGANVIE